MTRSGFSFTFGRSEMDRIRRLAAKRNDNKTRHSVPTRKKDDGATDLEVHIGGVMGEAAAAKLLGASVDTSIKAGGDEGVDFHYRGLSVEVKTRGSDGWAGSADFAMYDTSDLKTDLGILCLRIADRTVMVEGWTSQAHWHLQSEILSFGGRDRKGITRENMLPVQFLTDNFH